MSEYLDLWKLLAGLGLFLFGMRQLESALEKLSGKGFRRFLRESTDKPVGSVFGGIVATAIVQSSSLVSLIVMAFVGAGIIPLGNAIGIVLGSNLGTTITGWIVTTLGFKLNFITIVYPLFAIGGLSFGLLKGRWQSVSQLVLGLAFLLLGLDFMKDSVNTLTTLVDVEELGGYPLIVYLLIGVIFTAIIQSSSATMMLTLSALYAGIIPLPAAAALVIGADLGTTSTVLLGSLQGVVAKRRLAMAHVIFNVFVDALAFLFIVPLLSLIEKLQISDSLYALVAFHSLFNLFGLMLFLPFIKKYAALLERWIKEKQQHIDLYIHNVPETVTDAALEALTLETRHLLYLVVRLNSRFLHISPEKLKIKTDAFAKSDLQIDSATKLEHYIVIKSLEGEIINYALKIQVVVNAEGANSQEKAEEIARRIDNFMKAIRSGVYSAKSLKDINDNLEYFHLMDNDDLSNYFDALRESAQSIYSHVVNFLNEQRDTNVMDADVMKEELTALIRKSEEFHHDLANKIYKKMSRAHLSSLDLSTLLNVNKELQTSEKALIQALELL
jgi:phosphate:Na+ symporter